MLTVPRNMYKIRDLAMNIPDMARVQERVHRTLDTEAFRLVRDTVYCGSQREVTKEMGE